MAPSWTVRYARSCSTVPSTCAGVGVDDRDDRAGRRAQRDVAGRELAAAPGDARRRHAEVALLGQAERLSVGAAAEDRVVRLGDRRLVRGAGQVQRGGSPGWRGRGSTASTGRPVSIAGWRMKNWSSASADATSTASPAPLRPARPHCWRRLATVPGKPDRDRARRGGRCRCRARARSSRRRRAARRRPAAARARGAARPCSRRGRARSRRAEAASRAAIVSRAMRCTSSTARRDAARSDHVQVASDEPATSAAVSASVEARSPVSGVEQRRVPERDRARRPGAPSAGDDLDERRRSARSSPRPGWRRSPTRAGTAATSRPRAERGAAGAARSRRG